MSPVRAFDLVDQAEHEALLELWDAWHPKEVWAHPGVARSFAAAHDRPMCLAWVDERGAVLLPLILRPLDSLPWCKQSDGWDATTPYGYGGPFIVGDVEVTSDAFWDEVDAWADRGGVISLFGRLHLFDDQILPWRGEVQQRSRNIVRDLSLSEERLWFDYEHKVRKNVKRARSSGVTVTVHQDLETLPDFLRVYQATMNRRGASDSYHHDEEFFEQLLGSMPTCYAFFHARQENIVTSTELVLLSDRWTYSFLGGTIEDAYASRPNDLLKHEICLWSMRQGKAGFVLGGGYNDDDGILRYKKAFAPHGDAPFKTGSRIYDQDRFRALLVEREAWAVAHGETWSPQPGWFPAYRG